MARPWRIQFPGAIYHVLSRGNNRAPIFLDDADRRSFLELLGQAAGRFELEVFAFCLMPNHYHLFLRTARANLSRALQWLNASYAQRFHRRRRSSGHFFQGRYKAVLVAGEGHWRELSIYLHLNPVRAGLLRQPADYPWSSFLDYTRQECRYPWLRLEPVLSEYGRSGEERRRAYRRDCLGRAGIPAPDPAWEPFRRGTILGPAGTAEKLAKRHRPAGEVREVPEWKRRCPSPDVEQELRRVARSFAVSVEELSRPRRGLLARPAAYWHLVKHCGLPVKTVAEVFQVRHSAVSMGIRRLERQAQKQPGLARALNSLSD